MEYVLLIGGLIVLIISGELLVRGAVGFALKFKVSPLVIGMTIVSFGTSAPELLVSLNAAVNNHPELAIGNILGSNIANIALVLGVTTIMLPIVVKRATLRLDWPIMMLFTLLFYVFALNRKIEWWEGLIYVLGLIIFNAYLFWKSRRQNKIIEQIDEEISNPETVMSITKSVLFILIGVVGLAFGANWLLDGAVILATNFGVSEHVIGVTIVAFGTSVPELITSVMAAIKKETDISVGNLIGSNIFNLAAVLGITALVKDVPVSEKAFNNDALWMIGISLLLFPLMIKHKVGRFSGLILFVSYCLYVYFVVS